ncbi:hypothetical protein GCM10009087_47380 [Sphingomonas oligophenolica]|uniref:Uncharacterized protein n=1 Tax=Sphingomonas oligophenolica TaxID=301154 RepID=A0ABU9Y7B1_9SPHN
MRRFIVAALATAFASPAMAQTAPQRQDDQAIAGAAATLANPETAHAAGRAMAKMTGAILDTRVDELQRAADALRDRPNADPNAPHTVRDMVAGGDPTVERRVEERTEHSVATAGAAVRAAAVMVPELRATMAELRRNFQQALDEIDRR